MTLGEIDHLKLSYNSYYSLQHYLVRGIKNLFTLYLVKIVGWNTMFKCLLKYYLFHLLG